MTKEEDTRMPASQGPPCSKVPGMNALSLAPADEKVLQGELGRTHRPHSTVTAEAEPREVTSRARLFPTPCPVPPLSPESQEGTAEGTV